MELKDEEKETFKKIKIAVPKFEFSKEEMNLIEDDIEFNFRKYIKKLEKIRYENTEFEILRKLILKQQTDIDVGYIPKSKIKEINENTDMYYEFHDEVMKLVESEEK